MLVSSPAGAVHRLKLVINNYTKMEETLLKDIVYRRIKDLIISGEFQMGSKISESILEETLNANKAPVRDALKRLENERLVVRRAKSGTYVFCICQKDMDKLLQFRFVIEFEAAKLAVKTAKSRLEQELGAIFDKMKIAYKNNSTHDYLGLDSEFHQMIVDLCDNKYFIDSFHMISAIMDTVRNYLGSSKFHMERSQSQHEAIIQAVHDSDEKKIEELLKMHILPEYGAYWSEQNLRHRLPKE